MDLVIRFDYGWVVPWMSRAGDHLHGIAGPDSVCLATPAQTRGENLRTVAEFTVGPRGAGPVCAVVAPAVPVTWMITFMPSCLWRPAWQNTS